jgi:glycosyltransferase involved in cell wall biosynthesis
MEATNEVSEGSAPQPRVAAATRPHVLSLIDYPSGGAESFARIVTMHLDPERYRRTLCVTRAPLDPADLDAARAEVEAAGATMLSLWRRSRVDIAPWRKLVGFMRRERVDVLHGHKFGSNVWVATLRGLGQVPVALAHEHTWSYEGQPIRRLLDRHLVARRCDRIIAVSRLDRQRMIDIEGIDPHRIVVVPVGIPPRHASGHDVRAELGIEADAPLIVSVGHLRPQKAFEVLLEAAARLRAQRPDVRVLIVGEGPERPRLERLIADWRLEHTVVLLGVRHDVMDVVTAADVTVCCSDFEGSPQAVIEYMAAAKPVVGTRVGGLPDLISDGVTGTLVPPRAPDAVARAIDELLADPGRAAGMGRRGAERQRAELTIDVTISRLDALYQELLSATREQGRDR